MIIDYEHECFETKNAFVECDHDGILLIHLESIFRF